MLEIWTLVTILLTTERLAGIKATVLESCLKRSGTRSIPCHNWTEDGFVKQINSAQSSKVRTLVGRIASQFGAGQGVLAFQRPAGATICRWTTGRNRGFARWPIPSVEDLVSRFPSGTAAQFASFLVCR